MTTIPLIGDIAPLANGVRRGQLKRLSSDFSPYGSLSATLWLTSGEGFRLSSAMHTLGDSIAVGILRIEPVIQPQPEETSINLPWTFKNGGSVSRLILEQATTRVESGLLLRSADNDEIILVPAAFPHHLYIGGLDMPSPQDATPEYSLSRYLQESIQS